MSTTQSLLSLSTSRHEDTAANHDTHVDDENGEKEAVQTLVSHEKPLFPSLKPPAGAAAAAAAAGPLVLLSVLGHGAAGEMVPHTINRYLRDYQREGIRFIHGNYVRARGCILGDDMGLGKTVQVIGFLSAVLHKTGTWEDIENNKPRFLQTQSSSEQRRPSKVFLIVAPLSVLFNWKEELDTWGHFQCVVIHGPRKEEELARIRSGRFEIALTTYETLRLCLDQFNSIDWSAVVVDEAHKLKNPKSQITQAMKELKCQVCSPEAAVRIGLTGTILQNNLEEFWCVMDWAVPACLGSLGHFKNRYSDPVERGQRHSATKRSVATARRAVRTLAGKIGPWFLRRTKALIKDQLPKKDDRVVYCALTDFQRTVYETVLDSEDVMLILRSTDACDCQSGRTRRSCCYKTNSDGVEVKVLYFSYLTILRKVANHVALLQSTDQTSKKQKELVGAVCEKVFHKFPDFMRRCKEEAFEAISDPMYSGKMKVLQKLLRHYMKRRDKVLLFSLSTKLLDVLESYCMAEGLDYSRLDGTTKAKDRLTIVKEFNGSRHTNLCLVSTMAGGLGLNFVGANVVILFDPTWNPANDLQAIDRAYRIGQCRDVTVLRLISLGTVEEIIYLRQVYKQQLQSTVVDRESARRYFEAVQGTDSHQGELFGTKNLFRLQTQGTCLTRRLLEREGRVEAGVVTANTHMGGGAGGGGEEEEEEEEEEKAEAEAEETSEPGKVPHGDASEPKSRSGDGSPDGDHQTSRGVLDFSSSGSEGEEAGHRGRVRRRKAAAAAEPRGEDVVTPASRLSLLRCGFSRLLQGVAVAGSPASGAEEEEEDGGLSEGEPAGGAGAGGDPNPEDRSTGGARSSGTRRKKKKEVAEEVEEEEEEISQGSSSSGAPGNRRRRRPVGGGVSDDSRGGSGGEDGGRAGGAAVQLSSSDQGKWTSARRTEAMKKKKKKKKMELNQRHRGAAPLRSHAASSDSDESDDLGVAVAVAAPAVKPAVRKEVWLSPKGGAEKGGAPASADLRPGRKRHQSAWGLARSTAVGHTERIEAFTSSSDEEQQQHPPSAAKKWRPTRPQAHTPEGTIDNLLGGVSQVVYTHSNQRVVGGSRAEERISRAAVRDVFERGKYSQFPANHLLGTQESESEDVPESSPPRPPAAAASVAPGDGVLTRVLHPVTFSGQAVHRGRDGTFILGQTPQAVRSQQLEQMASSLGVSSVRVFAEAVLSSSSAQRLAWLRRYYGSPGHPELPDAVADRFPDPASASPPRAPRTPSKSVARPRPAPKPKPKRGTKASPQETSGESPLGSRSREARLLEPHKPPRRPAAVEEAARDVTGETKRTKRASVPAAATSRRAGGPGSNRASGGGPEPVGAAAPAAAPALDPADTDAPSSSLGLGDGSTSTTSTTSTTTTTTTAAPVKHKGPPPESPPRSAAAAVGRTDKDPPCPPSPARREASSPGRDARSLLAELIGDTSVLDDLFRPAGRRLPTATPSSSSSQTVGPRHLRSATQSSDHNSPPPPPHPPPPPPPPPPHPPPPRRQKPAAGRKDFWDILNEGSEESVERLADPSALERVCVRTARPPAWRTSGGGGASTLWKTNDKFLWRK